MGSDPNNSLVRHVLMAYDERHGSGIGFELINTFDIFQGENNPEGTGMPERWFVVYSRRPANEDP